MSRRMDAAVERALADRMRFALDVAEKSAQLVLRYFRTEDLSVETKSDASPVTIADREAEQFLRDQIGLVFPGDGILGEEHGEAEGGAFRWILDPIDGTESFIRGVPLFGTLVGLEWNGDPVGGILGLPALHETIYAWRGHGAWLVREGRRPKPARVSSVDSPDRSLLCMTSPGAPFTFGARRERRAFTRCGSFADGASNHAPGNGERPLILQSISAAGRDQSMRASSDEILCA